MTKRNYKLSENLEFRTSEQDETGIYFKGEFMRPIGGAEESLIDQVLDLERRLAEATTSLDRRDLIKQAEALEYMANEFDEQGEYRGYATQLEQRAAELRRQAKEQTND